MLEIYREISPDSSRSLLTWLERRDQLFPTEDDKGVEHLFIENDRPRDPDITEEIVARTIGFALFSDDGELVGRYRALDRAIKAAETATIKVVPDIEVAPDEDWGDEKADESA